MFIRQFFDMFYLAFVIYLFYSFVYLNASSKGLNLRPIIGIISQKVTTKFTPNISNSDTYIAASYVKQIEMAGAQVVPILPSYSLSKKKKLIRSVNGVLFPGGAAPVNDSGYFKTAKLIYEEAKKLNDKGNYYPVWGTCLGFETLQLLAAETDIRSAFDSENYLVPLNLTKDAIRSRLFKGIEKYLLESLMFEKVAFNMHSLGVGVDKYRTNSKLRAVFRVLSTNMDRKEKEFVSTIEGEKLLPCSLIYILVIQLKKKKLSIFRVLY